MSLSIEEKKAYQNAASKAYRERHRERVLEADRMRNILRREYIRAHDKRRTEDGRDQVKFAKGRAKKYGLSAHFTVAQWDLLKDITGRRCQLCLTSEKDRRLTVDHILPLSRGGGNTISNIQPLCRRCNSAKNRSTMDLREFCPIAA